MYNYKIINNEYVIFEMKKDEKIIEVMVDIVDFEDIRQYYWQAVWRDVMSNYYIVRSEYLGFNNGISERKTTYLHNYIMSAPKGKVVDHINHNPLDNRKSNLRLVNKSKNAKNRKGRNKNNTTGYRNVSYVGGKYIVQLQINGKNNRLGSFDDVHEAGRHAEEMRNEHYGEYAGRG